MTESSKKAGRVFVLAKGLSAPLEALWPLLTFLFCKDLGATPFQLTLLVAMKPLSALGAFYGCLLLLGRRERIKPYLACVTLLGLLPCLFFPFVDNLWFFILGQGCFMLSLRALVLAWGEVLKLNLNPIDRGKAFSKGASLHSLIHVLVPLLVSPWFDWNVESWKWIFFILALLQGTQLLLLTGLPVPRGDDLQMSPPKVSLLLPWKEAFSLLKRRNDFRHFQAVFFLCGSGLIMMHPVLPFFFKETLNLTYTEVSIATSLFKGIFFAATASSWAKFFNLIPIDRFNVYVTGLAALHVLFLMLSPHITFGLWIAYALYGAMQAGSEVSWNLSGAHYSKEEESTLFTSVNVASIGIRGMIVPFIGEFLFFFSGSKELVFGVGGLLCLSASIYSEKRFPLFKKAG